MQQNTYIVITNSAHYAELFDEDNNEYHDYNYPSIIIGFFNANSDADAMQQAKDELSKWLPYDYAQHRISLEAHQLVTPLSKGGCNV